MSFYLAALQHVAEPFQALSLRWKVAAGCASVAALLVVGGAIFGPGQPAEDAITVAAPVFTPVAVTAPAPAPAIRPSARDDAAPRFEDAVSVTRAVQAELKRAKCYSGPVNGVWSPSTRAAMGEFTARVNARLPVERPDPVLLALLETHNKISCTDDCSVSASGGKGCVPRAPLPREELASIERDAAPASRDARSAPRSRAAPALDEDRAEESQRYDPVTPAPIETASTESRDASAAPTAVVPARVAAPQRAMNAEPRRAPRRYKKQPSFSREVSKGFKSLQRSLNKLF